MRRHRKSIITACFGGLLAVGTTACDREPAGEPVTLTLSADSIIEMERDTLVDGSVNVVCPLTLTAEAAGDSTGHAIVRGGRVEYTWWINGEPAMNYDWSQEQAMRFFGDSIIRVGLPRTSEMHGFGQSAPGQPVRGTVQFRYDTSNGETEQETEPFRFYCY